MLRSSSFVAAMKTSAVSTCSSAMVAGSVGSHNDVKKGLQDNQERGVSAMPIVQGLVSAVIIVLAVLCLLA